MAEVAEAKDFDELVIERSHELPVLVDFWAPWCGPCRVLTPVLERAVEERRGEIELVKVNSDEHQELAARHGVRGIPDVRLFKDGGEVDRFVGALPLDKVRAFLREHCPSVADRELETALELLESGDLGGARWALESALGAGGDEARVRLALARLEMAEAGEAPDELVSKLESAREHLRAMPAGAEIDDQAEALLHVLDLASEATAAGDAESCRARLDADEDDHEARFALGGHALLRGDYRAALEHYLELARRDRNWRHETARKAMVTVFQVVGVREPLAEEFRDRLTRIYY